MKNETLQSLIAAAMNLTDTAMKMSGAELYHLQMRGVLESTKNTLNEVLSYAYPDIIRIIPAILIMIDTCLEEEGIAEAEIEAEYCGERDPEYSEDDDSLEWEAQNYTEEDYLEDVHKSLLWREVKNYHLEYEVDACLRAGLSIEEACMEWDIALPYPDDDIPF